MCTLPPKAELSIQGIMLSRVIVALVPHIILLQTIREFFLDSVQGLLSWRLENGRLRP